MSETIDHPQHYGGAGNPHEVIECLESWGLTEDAYLFNVVKYCSRSGKKAGEPPLKDLKKALWYLRRKIGRLEPSAPVASKDLEVQVFMPTIEAIQNEARVWANKNFPGSIGKPMHPFLGMVEELGELAHAILKGEQGIRGTAEEHEAKSKDAMGDLLIFCLDYCTKRDWSMGGILAETWAAVRLRDWNKNKLTGQA